MSSLPLPKKPKMEPFTAEEIEQQREPNNSKISYSNNLNDDNNNSDAVEEQTKQEEQGEQEEALIALIEHRTKEVEHLQKRIAYYKTQLDGAERRLEQTKHQLARLRGVENINASKRSSTNGIDDVKAVRRSPSPQNHFQSKSRLDQGNVPKLASPLQIKEGPSETQPASKPKLVIPPMNPRIPQTIKMIEAEGRVVAASGSRPSSVVRSHSDSPVKVKVEQVVEAQPKATKRKLEQREHKDVIPLIHTSSSPCTIRCQTSCLISSQHKRKLRSLSLCPTNDQLFVTSALDGAVNLWQLQGKGSTANRLSSTECVSSKERRWPEDIAWHPEGSSLFSVYTADGGDSQISILNLNKTKERARVTYLEEKPHVKGIINNIIFMPWEDTCFVTGGSDHAVVLWTDKTGEDSWKPKVLHRNMHSSAVMGVAGLQQKQTVLSVGADKRIIGYDLRAGRYEYKHQIESKCMSVLINPCDFNLFMVQTGTPERQLRLFDIRLRQTEIHAFGWKQESSESQSALINQTWSPDGLYLTSGSADPVIHIFDIRYNSRKPSQSVKAHQKRVFKAAWHYAAPLLISISSDLNIGLHKII